MAHKDPAPHAGHGDHGVDGPAGRACGGTRRPRAPDVETVQVGRPDSHADHRRRGVGLLHARIRRVESCSCRSC